MLVHGLGSKKENDWGRAVGPLSQKYHVIALDQIGIRTVGQAGDRLQHSDLRGFPERVFARTENREGHAGWRIAGRLDFRALHAGSLNGQAHGSGGKISAGGCAGLQQDKPIPDLNPSTLAAQRKVLEVVFYNSSWVTDDLVKKDLAERIHSNISYTVHSILSNPALASGGLMVSWAVFTCRRWWFGETGRTAADRLWRTLLEGDRRR